MKCRGQRVPLASSKLETFHILEIPLVGPKNLTYGRGKLGHIFFNGLLVISFTAQT